MAEPTYADVGGQGKIVSPGQAQDLRGQLGGFNPISQQQAQDLANASRNLSYVDENWGMAGKALAGLGSGLTLGLGPGVASQLGWVQPEYMRAAQESPEFAGGDIIGTVLPAFLSGGVGAAARATPAGLMELAGSGVERFFAGSAGLLGRGGSTALSLAARGATEGALINLGHTVGDSLIDNKPLAAESLAASSIDGALFGGLIGGGAGLLGSLARVGIEAAERLPARLAGSGAKAEARVAERLGADVGTDSGTLKSYIKHAGGDISRPFSEMAENVKVSKSSYETMRKEAITELSEQAPQAAPSIDRVFSRLDTDIVGPRVGTIELKEAMNAVEKAKAEIQQLSPKVESAEIKPSFNEWRAEQIKNVSPKDWAEFNNTAEAQYKKFLDTPIMTETSGPVTWEQWVKARDTLAAKTPSGFKSEILNVLDSEIRTAMEDTGIKGIAEKYGSATLELKNAGELEGLLGKKVADVMKTSGGFGISTRDMSQAMFVGGIMGHPAGALGMLAAKNLPGMIERKFEPILAGYAAESMIGAKAATATSNTREKIASSMKSFFSSTKKATKQASKAANTGYVDAKKSQRAKYENAVARTEALLSSNHQDRMKRYTEALQAQGYEQLARQLAGVNQRAVTYLLWNMPVRQSAKAAKSLRPFPMSKSLTLDEYKFSRIDEAIKNPMMIVDGLESGKVSRDQVQAIKYVYPELHAEVVNSAMQEVMEMKQAGKFLDMQKVAALGTVLDAPIDSTLTPEYIGEVQAQLNTVPPEQQAQSPSPTGQQIFDPTAVMTPMEKLSFG